MTVLPSFHPPQMKKNKTTPFDFDQTEAWGTDSFYVLGILGFFLYLLLGLTSLPSVGGSLSWREFSFVQVSACVENLPSSGCGTYQCFQSITNAIEDSYNPYPMPRFSTEFLKCCNCVTLEAIISSEVKLTN